MTVTIPKWVLLALLLATLTTTAWLAGEKHRENCQRAGKEGCSVLPWENGETIPPSTIPPSKADCLDALSAGEQLPDGCEP
jgi:hypothetical protein